MFTVALTSVPPRFDTLAARLRAILAQRPARVVLTLPHRYLRFPDWDGALPDLPAGVDLVRADDRGPATKFLSLLRNARANDVLIADDDCDYRTGWLAGFRSARAAHPGAVLAASSFDTARLGLPAGHRIVQGFAGVLLPPGQPGPNLPDPSPPAFWVDDIWLSAMLAHSGAEIVDCPEARARVVPQPAPAPLQGARIDGATRAGLNRQVASGLMKQLDLWRPHRRARH